MSLPGSSLLGGMIGHKSSLKIMSFEMRRRHRDGSYKRYIGVPIQVADFATVGQLVRLFLLQNMNIGLEFDGVRDWDAWRDSSKWP